MTADDRADDRSGGTRRHGQRREPGPALSTPPPGRGLFRFLERRTSFLAYASTLSLIAATLAWLSIRTGRLTLERPATILSNAPWGMKASEPYLLFLSEVARLVPRGSSVMLKQARKELDEDPILFFEAQGQLPGLPLRVASGEPIALDTRSSELPSFIACYRCELTDPRYRPVRRLNDGGLYRKLP